MGLEISKLTKKKKLKIKNKQKAWNDWNEKEKKRWREVPHITLLAETKYPPYQPSISFFFQFIPWPLNFSVPEDDADVILPWEKMRLKVHVEDPATGNTTHRDEPLSYNKLDIFCQPKGHPAFTLNFVEDRWEVTTASEAMNIRVDTHPLSSRDHWTSDPFDKLHGSFSLHFKCGELF